MSFIVHCQLPLEFWPKPILISFTVGAAVSGAIGSIGTLAVRASFPHWPVTDDVKAGQAVVDGATAGRTLP